MKPKWQLPKQQQKKWKMTSEMETMANRELFIGVYFT